MHTIIVRDYLVRCSHLEGVGRDFDLSTSISKTRIGEVKQGLVETRPRIELPGSFDTDGGDGTSYTIDLQNMDNNT